MHFIPSMIWNEFFNRISGKPCAHKFFHLTLSFLPPPSPIPMLPSPAFLNLAIRLIPLSFSLPRPHIFLLTLLVSFYSSVILLYILLLSVFCSSFTHNPVSHHYHSLIFHSPSLSLSVFLSLSLSFSSSCYDPLPPVLLVIHPIEHNFAFYYCSVWISLWCSCLVH